MTNVLLRSILTSTQHLNLCHVNGGSLAKPEKIAEFRRTFENTNAQVIVATETWLKSYHSNAYVLLDGYNIVRNDRRIKRSGGVAVYIKKGINYKVVRSSADIQSEYVFIEIIFPNSKMLLGAYYKAPNVKEIEKFDEVLSELSPSYTDVIILGDFNENLLKHDKKDLSVMCPSERCTSCNFKACMVRHALKSVGTTPTNFDGEPTLLDLILVNRPEKVLKFNQVKSGLSNHDLIFAVYSTMWTKL